MFTSSPKNTVVRSNLKCVFHIPYTPPSMNPVNGKKNQSFIDLSREDSAVSLENSYLEIFFNVTDEATCHARYAFGDYIKLVKYVLLLHFLKTD